MSDSKKRPHEAGTEVQTRSSDETAPVAKKMKMAEEPAKQTENASLPQEVRLKSLLIVKDRVRAHFLLEDVLPSFLARMVTRTGLSKFRASFSTSSGPLFGLQVASFEPLALH